MFKMPVRRQQSSESSSTRSNEGFIFLRCGKSANTVQTSWRPQLPLPKEEHVDANENIENSTKHSNSNETINEMERLHGRKDRERDRERENALNTSSQLSNISGGSSAKKWSFGRLFRRKKEIETESSSEEDRKAGFQPTQKYRQTLNSSGSKPGKAKNNKSNRSSKLTGAGFDHIVVNPTAQQQQPQNHQQYHADNELFLPVETIPAHDPYYQNHQQQYLPHGTQEQQQQQQYSRSSNSLDRRALRSAQPGQKSRSTLRLTTGGGSTGAKSSSEEELISLHSSTFSKYRSDESIHSGGQAFNGVNGQSRRSRAARNERYYKRLSRDGEVSHGQVPVMYAPQPSQRWKTQPVPLSIYNGPPNVRQQPTQVQHGHVVTPSPRLQRGAGSLQHVAPYVQWGQMQQQQQMQQHHQQQQEAPKNLQNSVTENKRSISYDSHIHLQNVNGRLQTKVLPPPPPPRDPMRRVQMTGQYNSHGQLHDGSSNDIRPLSYAFDQHGIPIQPAMSGLNNRCVSDDKIWASHLPRQYQSAHSLNMPISSSVSQSQTPQTTLSRRFITRAERDAHPTKKSLPNGIDFHYIADAMPRSRKPIHMLQSGRNDAEPPPSSGMVRTTKSGLPTSNSTSTTKGASMNFWKSMEEYPQRKGRDFERTPIDAALKPRSISSPRVGDLCGYTVPVYSEVSKPSNRRSDQPPIARTGEADSVICGSLHIKPGTENDNNYVEIRRHKDFNKSNSMPSAYSQQRCSGEITVTPNKYEEYVAEKRQQYHKPIFNSPTPPQRKLTIQPEAPPIYFPRKKPANLEEAINELEAIYRSLGLTEPSEKEKKERVPTPIEFEKYALAHADEYNDEDSPGGEPDPVRDDVAFRNIQLANLQRKAAEKQPPFGIPIGPIVPSPKTDYLHVTPKPDEKMIPQVSTHSPDIVKDDLAVRALRKDPPGPKEKFVYPSSTLQKKNRATRTQSANIYSLIQRDAAKPSGGDLSSFLELTRSIERSGSLSNLLNDEAGTDDVPSTLTLMRNIKAQEQPQSQATATTTTSKKSPQIPFRHPSQGGAICQLPEKLISSREEVHKPPVPLPRKSLTPEPTNANHQMEDALNKIAKDAQESSVKLSKELQELRKEALITASRPKPSNPEEERLEKDLQEIEAVSEAAKRCGKMLLETLPDAHEDLTDAATAKPRKLYKEGKLIKAIDQVSVAANAVCEKILKDIVTTEPPVIVQEAVKVRNKPQPEPLVMPKLIKKLDPIQSEKIEAIAKRCMRQLSELADSPDYDNLANQDEMPSTTTAPACNKNLNQKPLLDAHISSLAEVSVKKQLTKTPIEEIDQIMQECEAHARSQKQQQQKQRDTEMTVKVSEPENDKKSTNLTTSSSSAPNTGSSNPTSSFSSSSDCLAKSSSPSASRRQSSSITSFNPYSSSDYIKSPSSEYHAPSTDPIKTFSTTSYDVQSTSATPNITTNSTFSYSPSPSPPLNLTPVSGRKWSAANAAAVPVTAESTAIDRARSSSPSQYNSSEELAMIFGIEEKPRKQRGKSKQLDKNYEPQQQQQPQQQQEQLSESATVATTTTTQSNVSGNVGPIQGITHLPNVSLSLSLPLPLSMSFLSSSNHASSSCALPPASTNPNAACNSCYYACQNKPAGLRTTKTMTNTIATATAAAITSSNNNNNTNTTKTNSLTNAYRCSCSCSIPNSPISPNSCKLETILEHNETSEQPNVLKSCSDSHVKVKLSSNFNKVYASEISIIVEKNSTNIACPAEDYKSEDEVETGAGIKTVSKINQDNSNSSLIECDSLSSLEETSSNPDSGNVSLADFPLAGSTNTSLHLQTSCNSRFEIKNTYVTEVCITRKNKNVEDVEPGLNLTHRNETVDVDDFPRLPTAKELADSLKEAEENIKYAEESCKDFLSGNRSLTDSLENDANAVLKVVYETPQLNMNISEVRVNYDNIVKPTEKHDSSDGDLLEQIAQCNAEVEKLSQVLKQMPRRRSADRSIEIITKRYEDKSDEKVSMPLRKPECKDNIENADSKQIGTMQHDDNHHHHHIAETTVRQRHFTSSQTHESSNSGNDEQEKLNSNVVSLFGEIQPANRTSLTTLEHVLMACSLGVISSNDLFTLFLIIIGIVTIFAIVLC